MPIAVVEDHRQLATVARSFLETHSPLGVARAYLEADEPARPPFWTLLGTMGWLGLHVEEQFGGSGFGLLELAVVLEEMGRNIAPGPFLPTVIASATINDAGSTAQCHRWLPHLVEGTLTAGVGLMGTTSMAPTGSLSGSWPLVLGAGNADILVLASEDDVIVMDSRQDGVNVQLRENLDPTRRAHTVTVSDVVIDSSNVIVGGKAVCTRVARVLAAAEGAGGASACVEAATQYAKVREQFGRTIATFQAVKHKCAEMFADAERAVAASWAAARVSKEAAQRELLAAVAALESVTGFVLCAKSNIQIHGGIGFTWEHDAHLYLRRAGALAAFIGPTDVLAVDVTLQATANDGSPDQVDLPAEAEHYRQEVRDFLARVEQLDDGARKAAFLDEGYAHPHWPRPWGRDANPVEQLVIEEELRDTQRPGVVGIGNWIVLTLTKHATDFQASRWIRPSMEGDLIWCQLFSEPDAGSDAAGIRTRAERVAGGWLINGQKIWTSGAQVSTHGLATVRTDPEARKHAGITTVVIDMKAPGVEVRPLRVASGKATFNEVFFSDVFVPDDDVVGPVNAGWTVARSTLGNERVSIGRLGYDGYIRLEDLYETHRNVPGAPAAVGRLISERETLQSMNLRLAERALAGVPGPEGNISKMIRGEHGQRTAELAFVLAQEQGAYLDGPQGPAVQSFISTRGLTIAGGTSEIVRNQIAEQLLGMPRDPLLR